MPLCIKGLPLLIMYSLFQIAHTGHIHLYRQYFEHVYEARFVWKPEMNIKVMSVIFIDKLSWLFLFITKDSGGVPVVYYE